MFTWQSGVSQLSIFSILFDSGRTNSRESNIVVLPSIINTILTNKKISLSEFFLESTDCQNFPMYFQPTDYRFGDVFFFTMLSKLLETSLTIISSDPSGRLKPNSELFHSYYCYLRKSISNYYSGSGIFLFLMVKKSSSIFVNNYKFGLLISHTYTYFHVNKIPVCRKI